MKKLLLFIGVIVIMTSCDKTKREYSGILHEKVLVVTLIYTPSQHKTELTNTMMDDYSSPLGGTDWNGNKGVKIGKINGQDVQITSSTIPEKYGVVFQCQHGTFTVEGSEQKHKILYHKLLNSVRDTVDVLYKEEYLVTYDDKNKDGKDEIVSKVLNDLDFIDAQIIQKNEKN